ncbi:MAG: DUF4234 domain-containing protein [Sandaracinaceae bacterium]|nr:DUF4234 domain-containing protein [Sandaracinaceae bacterium]
MQRREAWLVIVLSVVTCGIYYFYWQYATTSELKQVSGRDDLNPGLDLLITILLCGVYGIYVQYRNAQVVHQVLAQRGQPHEDRSQFILILHLVHLVTGVTGIIAMAILQDELNKLATQ